MSKLTYNATKEFRAATLTEQKDCANRNKLKKTQTKLKEKHPQPEADLGLNL